LLEARHESVALIRAHGGVPDDLSLFARRLNDLRILRFLRV
jgi:hypothetical protein